MKKSQNSQKKRTETLQHEHVGTSKAFATPRGWQAKYQVAVCRAPESWKCETSKLDSRFVTPLNCDLVAMVTTYYLRTIQVWSDFQMLFNLARLQKTQLYFAMATRANSPVNMKTKAKATLKVNIYWMSWRVFMKQRKLENMFIF